MRTLVVTQNVTLDGSIEMLGDWFDPQAQGPAGTDDLSQEVQRQSRQADEWANSTVLTGDPADQVRALKADSGRDIVVTGSIQLTHTLISEGLVDEYRLFVYPVVQGAGRPLFPEGVQVPRLELLDSQTFRAGIVLLRYSSASTAP